MKVLPTLARAVLVCSVAFVFVPSLLAQTAATEIRDDSDNSLLYLDTAAGLVVRGSIDNTLMTDMPTSGAGIRMMWYPAFAAFRAGGVVGGTPRIPGEANTATTVWDQDYVGIYSTAFGLDTQARGDYSFAAGIASFAGGHAAVAMGESTTATGTSSVALGYRAHTNSRQGSFVFSDRSSDDAFRAGVNNSANWRVNGGFRVFTRSDLSTGVTIQSGQAVSNWGQSNAVISTSTGAYLHTNGTWTNNSDSTRKHLVEDVAGEDVLARLRTLPIKRWTYRTEPDSVRHLGPMAQDFHAIFGLGDDEKTISAVDADGVALAAAQALEVRSRAQETQLAGLHAENAALRTDLEALRADLEGLRAELDRRPSLARATTPLGAIGALLMALGTVLAFRRRSPDHQPS